MPVHGAWRQTYIQTDIHFFKSTVSESETIAVTCRTFFFYLVNINIFSNSYFYICICRCFNNILNAWGFSLFLWLIYSWINLSTSVRSSAPHASHDPIGSVRQMATWSVHSLSALYFGGFRQFLPYSKPSN